jgi:hypothetical protein
MPRLGAGVKLYGGESMVTSLDASVSGDLPWFKLPGGNIAMAAGIDLRREEFRFDGDQRADKRTVFNAPFDDANALGNVSRDIKAVFVELSLPVFKNFDINLAGRYDRLQRLRRHHQPEGLVQVPAVRVAAVPRRLQHRLQGAELQPAVQRRQRSAVHRPGPGRSGDLPDRRGQPERGRLRGHPPGRAVRRQSRPGAGGIHQKSFGLVYSPMSQFNIAWTGGRSSARTPSAARRATR